MQLIDAERILRVISAIDGRTVDEEATAVWASLLDDIPAADALQAVREFFRTHPDQRINPGHVRAGALKLAEERFRRQAAISDLKAGARPRTACGRKGCQCTHQEPCEAGWIEADGGGVHPCATCRSDVAAVISAAGGDRGKFQRTIRSTEARQEAQNAGAWD